MNSSKWGAFYYVRRQRDGFDVIYDGSLDAVVADSAYFPAYVCSTETIEWARVVCDALVEKFAGDDSDGIEREP